MRLERGAASENVGKLANAPRLQQLELVDFNIGVGFKAGLKVAKNIMKLLIIPTYQVTRISTSGETLCRDNCQLIDMSFFYTRSAGKNNRN